MKVGFFTPVLVGLAFLIVFVTYGYFQHYVPNVEEAKNYDTLREQLETEANKLPKAVARRNDAVKKVIQSDEEWASIVATRTPTMSAATGGIDLRANPWQMTVNMRPFRNSVQQAINRQLVQGGVKVISGPTIPFPSEEPTGVLSFLHYPELPFPVVAFNLGQVTVQGTYGQIKANMKAYSHMPNYLAVADGLQLTGTSPVLTGTYSLSIIGFVRGGDVYEFGGRPTPAPTNTPPGTTPPANKGAAPGAAPGGKPGPQRGAL